MKLTAKQVQRKYRGRYVDVSKCPFWDTNQKGEQLFEVRKSYAEIRENTCKAEDVGTSLAYTR
jgi:hypothetical protein